VYSQVKGQEVYLNTKVVNPKDSTKLRGVCQEKKHYPWMKIGGFNFSRQFTLIDLPKRATQKALHTLQFSNFFIINRKYNFF